MNFKIIGKKEGYLKKRRNIKNRGNTPGDYLKRGQGPHSKYITKTCNCHLLPQNWKKEKEIQIVSVG